MKDANPKAIRLKDYQPPHYLIEKTELRIDLHESYAQVTSVLRIHRNKKVAADDSVLVLDGQDMTLQQVSIDGEVLNSDRYTVRSESLTIDRVPDQFELSTVTQIEPQNNTSLEGLYKSKKMFCTQCEAEGFRKITYYLDRPDVMSEFTTTISADKQRYPVLLSNGNPVAQGESGDGRHWQTWHDPFKKPAYLFAMVAGDLVSVNDEFLTCSGRNVTLKLYVEEKDLDKCEHAMSSLKNAMAWDEKVYGREYDLDIFMIVAVDDFNMGAMENKGLNIFNTSCVLAKPDVTTDAAFQRVEAVVAHEYFHNWSGNRVTCRDWFQLSLKEGFTVFRDSQFSSDMGSATVKRVEDVMILRTMQFAEDAGPMSHPVQPASYIEISNFYTLTIYEKGAEVVRMLFNLLGPELFRQGSDLYFQRHDGQAVTIDEFAQAMADVSGRDLAQFKRWYTQAGTPRLTVSDQYDAANKTYQLTIRQNCPPTPESANKLSFHIPVAMGLIGAAGEVDFQFDGNNSNHCVLELKEDEQQFTFNNVSEKPVPALLRGFSAPVKLHFDYSRDDLMLLMQHETDGFCRWDASQQLAIQVIRDAIDDVVAGQHTIDKNVSVDSRLLEAYRAVLADHSLDPAMVALMLRLPSEAYLSELADVVDVDAIHWGREKVRRAIAEQLHSEFLAIYDKFDVKQTYAPTAEQIAQRSLKNTALSYLANTESGDHFARCEQQYRDADNMTDVLGALVPLVNSEASEAQTLASRCLDDYYRRWQQEPLAVDQWLVVQASAQTADGLEKVRGLLQHECFDIANPNKVRSLIGAFCGQNLINFHRVDGQGYVFLTDQILHLNEINPQIAARLLTPLTRWRKYQPQRQELMCGQLQRLLQEPKLSKDVYEVVSKSLA